ncbi:hypothetical protein I350_02226 [Cryptococcus amylolentus CBS 6273]|uniref:Inositol-pentakisphosphate 2-kinase n=1 Tax=Cryptococcus amylolentus CBS 6273 TaxID=1296118 RepID=A0A1E3KCI5_9TREE|nr:hypothetical protein I350_02226 [Cryptococcus amylolentus CBS 6273]
MSAAEPSPSLDTAPEDWPYTAEGGAHIVFSYGGPSSPAYDGKVLRLRKPDCPPPSSDHQTLQNKWRYELLPRLLPRELLAESREVIVEAGWFRELLILADKVRPDSRKQGVVLADMVETSGNGLLMDDATAVVKEGLESLAVEIKPKWGFLPSPTHMCPPESVPIKSRISRFTLHRHLKGHDDEKDYDPLDLFSGQEQRIERALDALWTTWETSHGRGNNWRVFSFRIPRTSAEGTLSAQTSSFFIPVLLSSPALQQLKSLQSTLDPTDISHIATLFHAAYPNAPLFDPEIITDITLSELEQFLQLYLSDPAAGKDVEKWDLRQRMVAYTLSAIFKDCSIFVKAVLHKTPEETWELVQGRSSVKIIDLDVKPIKNMKRWAETDEKIWKYWMSTKGARNEPRNIVEISSSMYHKITPINM